MPNLIGLDPRQVRDLIVRPVLARLALPSPDVAERLLMGTAAQESRFRYLAQIGGGPALGLWQMEPATFRDLWARFGPDTMDRKPLDGKFADQLRGIRSTGGMVVPVDQLAWNLQLAAAMCRIHYYARPFEMPERVEVGVLALIWKEHYNTKAGKGTPLEFIRNYRELVEPVYA